MSEVTPLETKEAKAKRIEKEQIEEIARLRKLSYDAHRKAGFKREDSLWLCCANEETE